LDFQLPKFWQGLYISLFWKFNFRLPYYMGFLKNRVEGIVAINCSQIDIIQFLWLTLNQYIFILFLLFFIFLTSQFTSWDNRSHEKRWLLRSPFEEKKISKRSRIWTSLFRLRFEHLLPKIVGRNIEQFYPMFSISLQPFENPKQ